MQRKINWNLVSRQLAEAREQLQELEALAAGPGRRNEGLLQEGLENAYHHINFAWNARHMTDDEHRSMTAAKFTQHSRYPGTLRPIGTESKKRK
jgi:hypothetical protein